MKVLGVLLMGLLTLGATSARAQGKCGLFSSDPVCQRSTTPNVEVDFTKGTTLGKLAWRPSSQIPGPPAPAGPSKQAIDCQMIRSADRNHDPKMVKAPPSAVKHALRVIEAPPCPGK